MTTMTRRVEGIRERSRKLQFLPTMELWVTTVFWSIAWFIGKVLKGLWIALAFIWFAIASGFTEGIGKS